MGFHDRRFSLFNTRRWKDNTPPGPLGVVPVLFEGPFSTEIVDECVNRLKREGSVASPGFMNPEGVVVFMHASRTMYKVTCEKDNEHKGTHETEG